jgi:hypothetical protein
MRTHPRIFVAGALLALGVSLCGAVGVSAQTAGPAAGACLVKPVQGATAEAAPGATSGVRVVLTGADGKPLKAGGRRLRLYLLARSARESVGDWSGVPRREDSLKGASPELRAWLARHDCDTLYCPEYAAEYERATAEVPEFKKAFEDGLRKYKNRELALRWMTVNFPLKNVRTEYYARKKAWLTEAGRKAGAVSSVMTDETGAAFFLGVKPGPYFVSNLLPNEAGTLWDCAVNVPPPVPKQLHSVSLDLGPPKQP